MGAVFPRQRHNLWQTLMLWIIALTIPVLLGIALLWRGLRGRRIDDHPLCRRCRYDLIGAVERPVNCPECGSKLDSKRSIRVGHRKRRWVSLSLGAFIIALTTTGTILLIRARASNFDFNPCKPLWVLRWEVTGQDRNRSTAAKREILNRFGKKELSASQMSSLAVQALRLQSDVSVPWDEFWGEVFEASSSANAVSGEQRKQFITTAIQTSIRLGLPARVRQGKPLMLQVEHKQGRLGKGTSLLVEMNEGPVLIDDSSGIREGQSGASRFSISSNGAGSHGNGVTLDVPTGMHRVSLECTCRVGPLVTTGTLPPLWDPDHDLADYSWVAVELPLHLQADVEVVASDAAVVELIRDDSMNAAVQKCVTIENCTGGSAFPMCFVRIDRPPVSLAFDVLWRANGREGRIGAVTQPAGESWMRGRRTFGRDGTGFPEGSQTVDIILRSNPELVEENADYPSIWEGEIVIKDVPVKWAQPRASKPRNQ